MALGKTIRWPRLAGLALPAAVLLVAARETAEDPDADLIATAPTSRTPGRARRGAGLGTPRPGRR